MPIRVAVIDDHQLLAQGLQVWLNDNAQDVQCVYAGCDPDAALAADLDLVLLDIDLGAELPSAAELVDRFVDHGIAVVLVSALETGAKVRDALLSEHAATWRSLARQRSWWSRFARPRVVSSSSAGNSQP